MIIASLRGWPGNPAWYYNLRPPHYPFGHDPNPPPVGCGGAPTPGDSPANRHGRSGRSRTIATALAKPSSVVWLVGLIRGDHGKWWGRQSAGFMEKEQSA